MPIVMLARITQAVTRQSTIVPFVAANVDLTVKGTGMVFGSSGVNGAPTGLVSPLLPVVNVPVVASHSVRSAVH